jgi:hypothetical protein
MPLDCPTISENVCLSASPTAEDLPASSPYGNSRTDPFDRRVEFEPFVRIIHEEDLMLKGRTKLVGRKMWVNERRRKGRDGKGS